MSKYVMKHVKKWLKHGERDKKQYGGNEFDENPIYSCIANIKMTHY
jgi:hypothetical protein